jgi:hypothetical protein
MGNGPSHPNEQLTKNKAGAAAANGTNPSASKSGSQKQVKHPPVARDSGPIGPNEQAYFSVSGNVDDAAPDSATTKSKSRNGSASQADAGVKRLRFNISLQARLAKGTDFAIHVFSPDTNRGAVVIESIHVGVYRKRESVFSADLPIRKDSKINPGAKKVIPFSTAQQKELTPLLRSKSFVMVTAVYTAPALTQVAFSVENVDDKKK